ncbi:MAG: GNAT family N-acetyltransferase [Lachnospiraceae bacterium]|nr:GNAT family N-acetyltransferase [Lachnospiraceae bacterium]
MEIRHSTEEDFQQIMKIYEYARHFMAEHGNPNQWGPTNWPPEELIHSDIAAGNSYVCTYEDKIVGTFFFNKGKDIEPTYDTIENGAWLDDSPYAVIHRLAGDGSVKGIGSFCIKWALSQCPHLRMDTHGDNIVMQNLLQKNGLTHCGTIYVEEDSYPRLAYEKVNTV